MAYGCILASASLSSSYSSTEKLLMLLEQLLLARYLALGVEPNRPGEALRLPPDPNVVTTLLIALSRGDLSGEKLILDRFCYPASPWPAVEFS